MDLLTHYLPFVLAGTLYGFIFGIIPVAGATTALLTLFGFIEYFKGEPYGLVAFCVAVSVSASVGDLFASVVLNIPGGGGSTATMLDGYPMARRGESARAMSAAVFSATLQGLFWGVLAIMLLPYYKGLVLAFGIPEMLAFLILAFACVTMISSDYWVRGIIGLALGIFVGLIGTDPVSGDQRFTLGWLYLADGIQAAPLMAGVMAIPEILEAFRSKSVYLESAKNNWEQIKQGARDVWDSKKDSFQGGVIGAIVGALPALGGSISEWLSYGQAVASNKNPSPPFGEGNVKGIIAPEGANLAHKATAFVPTVLFGVPGAPFEVIIISLLAVVGLDMGSSRLLADTTFYSVLSFGYMTSLVVTFFIAIAFIRYATLITRVPFIYWGTPTVMLLVWACVQYTGLWEDYAVLIVCIAVGFSLKYLKISRISFIIGFALADKIALVGLQFLTLFSISDLLTRPISLSLLLITVGIIIRGLFFTQSKIKYI